MAVPAFIGDSRIIVALITKFRSVLVTAHACAVQVHRIGFFVTGLVDSSAVPNDGFLPILQQELVIDPDVGLGLDTFLLIGRKLGFGDIPGLPAHRIIPERRGDQHHEEDQPGNNLFAIIHGFLSSLVGGVRCED